MAEKNKTKIVDSRLKLKRRQRLLHTVKALKRLVSLIFLSGFAYLAYFTWNHEVFKITEIKYSGLSEYGKGFVSKLEIDSLFVNKNIFLTNPGLIKKNLYNRRIFREINVYRSLFPARVKVKFVERVPFVMIEETKNHKKSYLDLEGIILPPLPNKKLKELKSPYLVDKIQNYQIKEEQLEVIKILEKLKKNGDFKGIGSFDLSEPENLVLLTPKNKIILGNLENIVNKLSTYQLLENLAEKNKNDLEYIDVRFWKNPVLKLKKEKSVSQ